MVRDPYQLHRTNFFPGLGWLLSRKLYEELKPRYTTPLLAIRFSSRHSPSHSPSHSPRLPIRLALPFAFPLPCNSPCTVHAASSPLILHQCAAGRRSIGTTGFVTSTSIMAGRLYTLKCPARSITAGEFKDDTSIRSYVPPRNIRASQLLLYP
jgi:hypothetical protein